MHLNNSTSFSIHMSLIPHVVWIKVFFIISINNHDFLLLFSCLIISIFPLVSCLLISIFPLVSCLIISIFPLVSCLLISIFPLVSCLIISIFPLLSCLLISIFPLVSYLIISIFNLVSCSIISNSVFYCEFLQIFSHWLFAFPCELLLNLGRIFGG